MLICERNEFTQFQNMLQNTLYYFKIVPRKAIVIKLAQLFLDLSALAAAFILAFALRFEFSLTADQLEKLFSQIAFVVLLQLTSLRICKVHKFIWRYVSVPETKQIVFALFLAALPMLFIRFAFSDSFQIAVIPLSITIFDFFLATFGIIGIRLLRREVYDSFHRSNTSAKKGDGKKSILLLGAGRAGVMTLNEIKNRGDIDISVKGFVDDEPLKHGAIINGVEVLGGTTDLPELVKSLKIDQVVISIAQASREDFQRMLKICRSIPVKVRTIPGLYELLQEKVSVSRIRDVKIEDLLGRPPIQMDKNSVEDFLKQKTVMITGAGGSIGSELVRQLVHCKTAKIVLVERSEFALFQIEREIKEDFPDVQVVSALRDICDEAQMARVFEQHKPQIIFHAAAFKHVPMMEVNAAQAIKNNILGTYTLGEIAGRYNADSFVLISTDKAVNPTSVMGASKRVSELIVQHLNARFETRFVAVRFGNVIGSNGSVIPTFREQIEKGGPVTVTHPEMERFFMTIPEASQLVLQAGSLGVGGEIFVLDMGNPMKILDLAKETIRLSGLEPGVDIQIKFTGIRPGEKLFEEIQSETEKLSKTIHPKIFIGKLNSPAHLEICDMLKRFEELSESPDNEEIRRYLHIVLPESNLEVKDENTGFKIVRTKDFQIPRSKVKAVTLGSK
jgi:FlaA1/EpsC-like NDP-sugar epimerase